jgi:hypothetical protein
VELPLHNPFWSKIWQIETVKTLLPTTRGYFGIGVERISKAVNLGNLLRSAHAFGASFAFTVGADQRDLEMRFDTSHAEGHLPLYHWPSLAAMRLPTGCSLVGVEILDEASDCPVFSIAARSLYSRSRAGTPARRSLPASCAHSHCLFPQRRDGRRDRHVRPPALPRPLCSTPRRPK